MLSYILETLARLFSKDKSTVGLEKTNADTEKHLTGVRKEIWIGFLVTLVLVFGLLVWFS